MYKLKVQNIFLGLVLFVMSNNLIFAQNQGTTSLQFLKILPSAKLMGMGETGVAIQDNAESVYLNPAGLSKVENFDIRFSTVDWFLDTKINSASIAYKFGNYGSFGLNVLNINYGEFEETRVDLLGFVGNEYNPGLTGTKFNAGATLIGFTYSKALIDRFSFGLSVNYIREDLYKVKMETTMFNFGILYDFKINSIKLGLALKNIGSSVKYVDKKNSIPQTMIIGVSGNLISDNENENLFMTINNQRLTFVADIVSPHDDTQKYHLGLEYNLYKYVNFRAGYKIGYDTESYSFGLGINYSLFSIDYAYNDLGSYWDAAHRLSIGVTF